MMMPTLSPYDNGDWVEYVNLPKGEFELIEREAGHVFRPLTSGYYLTNL